MSKFKVVLGQRLPDFSHPLKFKLPNGDEATIKFTLAHVTQSELDSVTEGAIKNSAGVAVLEREQTDAQLKLIVTGWDLEEEFSWENMQTLLDFYPLIKNALLTDYAEILFGVKLKN